MNKTINTLKQSFRLIKQNKALFTLLFFLQTGFIVLISYIFIHYYIIITDSLAGISQLMETIKLDTANMQQMLAINTQYNSTLKIAILAFVLAYLSYVLINGLIWDLSNKLVNKKFQFPKYEFQFALLTIIFTLPAILIFRAILKSLISLQFVEPMKIVFIAIIIITWYFMMIAFSLIQKHDLKQILKKAFIIGCKKAKILIPAYLIIIIILSLILYLVYYAAITSSLLLIIISLILLVESIIWSRIYFLTTAKNL